MLITWMMAAAVATRADTLEVPSEDYPTIQSAIDAASAGDTVLVAPGVYVELIDLLGKAITVESAAGAAVTTIDGAGQGSVVTCANGEGPGTIVEGFTITGGDAELGGGMRMIGTAMLVRSCVIAGNRAARGGGVHSEGGGPTLESCTISGNAADLEGGGVVNEVGPPYDGTMAIAGGTMEGNDALIGGGIFNRSELDLHEVVFTGNAAGLGGGLFGDFFPVHVQSCEFSANVAAEGGGIHNQGQIDIFDTVFDGNTAILAGGAVFSTGGLDLHGSLIEANTARNAGGVYGSGFVDVSTCQFIGNVAVGAEFQGGGGGGLWATSSFGPVEIRSCEFRLNAASSGAGLHASGSHGAIVDCLVTGNLAIDSGFHSALSTGGGLPIVRCTVSANEGSGIWNGGPLVMASCLVTDNAESGVVNFTNPGVVTTHTNCTVANNGLTGIATFSDATDVGSAVVTNCVAWGNGYAQIANGGRKTDIVTYSIVQDGMIGEGNLDADPAFVDAGGGDYRLAPGSPAIDAGANSAVPADEHDADDDGDDDEPVPDIDGADRILDGNGDGTVTVDIGAYESPAVRCTADVTGDGVVDVADLAEVVLAWGPCPGCPADIDGNGGVDVLDLVSVISGWGCGR